MAVHSLSVKKWPLIPPLHLQREVGGWGHGKSRLQTGGSASQRHFSSGPHKGHKTVLRHLLVQLPK